MNRQQLIERGKIWQVYPDGEPDNILFEGNKTAAKNYISKYHYRQYKKGIIRLAQIIWEQ